MSPHSRFGIPSLVEGRHDSLPLWVASRCLTRRARAFRSLVFTARSKTYSFKSSWVSHSFPIAIGFFFNSPTECARATRPPSTVRCSASAHVGCRCWLRSELVFATHSVVPHLLRQRSAQWFADATLSLPLVLCRVHSL